MRHADKIVVLDKGRVLEEGTHSELLARGTGPGGSRYAEMWEMQMSENDKGGVDDDDNGVLKP